jgi:ubiquinone biosynthesis protein Coq4
MGIKYTLALDASLKLLREPFDPQETGKLIDALADSRLLARLHERMIRGIPPEQVEKLRTLTCTPLEEEVLLALPEDTFGYRYADYMRKRGFSLQSEHDIYPPVNQVFAQSWLLHRLARLHDMLHLLLGFDIEAPSEAAMQLFHWRNFREPFGAMAMASLPFIFYRHGRVLETTLALRRAWRLASEAENLFVTPLEEMFADNLGDVRRRLRLPAVPERP